MTRESYVWACTAAQLLNVIALIRMGAMHQAIAKGDWSHPVSRTHLLILCCASVVNCAGAAYLSVLHWRYHQ
jgi:hypothetical protein